MDLFFEARSYLCFVSPKSRPSARSKIPITRTWFARKTRIAPSDEQRYLCNMQSETQWRQVMARDARQDGRFVFAVRTTGIYCRPSCPSRRPRRDSVEFFPDPKLAERAGYRACLRCKPTEISAQAQAVTRARQLLEEAEGAMTLAGLSKHVGLSPFHLQRLFKRATGLSPREYQSARRMQHLSLIHISEPTRR